MGEYIPVLILFSVSASAALFVIVLSSAVGGRRGKRADSSPYECGVNPAEKLGRPIDVKFFMMAIIFLVFDVEVALLYPWAAMFRRLQGDGHLTLLILEGASFAAALVVALVHVIRSGLLEWGEKSEGRGQELKEKS